MFQPPGACDGIALFQDRLQQRLVPPRPHENVVVEKAHDRGRSHTDTLVDGDRVALVVGIAEDNNGSLL
ncbi:MAG: hypothetical protein M0Z25_07665 [Nitrospiraceae bacterium]|nr:hypothetical protein [Nitrospiraceae bacterium]